MRLLSFAFLPFFFLPLDPADIAPVSKALPSTVDLAPVARFATPEPEPVPGHRAEPSGCTAATVPLAESVSTGTPTRGRLTHGKFLEESELVRHVDASDCNFWGTDELVGAIERVATAVAEEHPGHRLTVGELSKRRGGDIRGHGSHENGRDVDFGFYFLDEAGLPYEPGRLIRVRRDKTARADGEVLTFDVARNWKLVEALLTDEEADVNIILVDARIRRWLLAHARSIGVADELYRHASRVLLRPRRGDHPHRNHFHVRVYCPESDERCRDFNGLWDWVERARAERAARAEAAVTRPAA